MYKTNQEAVAINELINSKYSNYVNSYYVTENSLEIISNKTNKSIEMVKDFNGYAMINSVQELKQVATKEFESVSDLINEIM